MRQPAPIIRCDPGVAALADRYPGPATGRVGYLFKKLESGLAGVRFKRIDPYVVGKLIGNVLRGDVDRLANIEVDTLLGNTGFVSRVDPIVMIGDLQGEQGLIRDHTIRIADYRYDVILPKAGEKLVDTTNTSWLSKGRLFILREGDPKMVKGTGAGIPDSLNGIGRDAPWDLDHYLGFDKQIYHSGRLSRKKFDEWRPDLEVLLYEHGVGTNPVTGKPYAYQITPAIAARCEGIPDAVLAGREPLMRIRCADKMAYKRVMYTPALEAVIQRDRVINEMLGALG